MKSQAMKSKLLLLAILLLFLPSLARSADDTDVQLWADYDGYFYFRPNWEFYGDAGFRTVLETIEWQKIYARPSLRYHVKDHPLEGRGGFGVFYTHNDTTSNQLELRPWGGLLVKWPKISSLTISNYFRLEGRFIWNTDDWSQSETLRFRYRVGTKITQNLDVVEKYFYIPVSAEWFANVGPDVAEVYSGRFRGSVGLGYIFNNIWVGEFHFTVQSSRSGSDQTFETNDYIFRFQIKRFVSARDYMQRE